MSNHGDICHCVTCDRDIHYLGIASHKKGHFNRCEQVTIEFSDGRVRSWDYRSELCLSVLDMVQNGSVWLARFKPFSKSDAIDFMNLSNFSTEGVDVQNDAFIFVLHLKPNLVDINLSRMITSQDAMRIAPEQVQAWLNEKPLPDEKANEFVPILELPTL